MVVYNDVYSDQSNTNFLYGVRACQFLVFVLICGGW